MGWLIFDHLILIRLINKIIVLTGIYLVSRIVWKTSFQLKVGILVRKCIQCLLKVGILDNFNKPKWYCVWSYSAWFQSQSHIATVLPCNGLLRIIFSYFRSVLPHVLWVNSNGSHMYMFAQGADVQRCCYLLNKM